MFGTLMKWNEVRGFGFVELEDGRQAFVHVRDVELWPHDSPPQVGDVLEFELLETTRGPRAAQARIVKSTDERGGR